MGQPSLFAELKRRNVLRAAALYVGAGWALSQGVAQLLPVFDFPNWVVRWFVIAAVIGFPFAVLFSWFYEWTPRGIVRESEVPPKESVTRETGKRMDRWIIAVLSLAVVLLLADILVPHKEAQQASAATAPDKSIAVLAFDDLSPGHDQGYFSDGMSEEILNALAQVKDLKVAGRTSSFYYKGRSEDLRTIGNALGVANILEGSVRKQGDKVRITARLIRVADDTHLWSHDYDGDLSDVFGLQDRIARAITDQLQVTLVGDQKTRLVPVATTNQDAYALYLQATAIFDRRDGPHIPDAIADLRQALALDPKFARAHARLASLYVVANTYNNTLDLTDSLAATQREAKAAIALDQTLGEPYAALGLMYEYQRHWVAAREAAEQAVARDPGDPTANIWLGLIRLNGGYRRQGLASLDRALAIDPLLPIALAWRGYLHLDAGNRETAQRMGQRAVDEGLLFPESFLAMMAHEDGHDPEAIAHFTRSNQLLAEKGFPDDATAILARGLYGDAAQHARALAMLDAYVSSGPRTISPRVPWAFLVLGEPERALAVAQQPQTPNDSIFLVWLWSSRGAAARRLPQFPEFARKFGYTELWEKYGQPDDCHRKGPGDYVCE